MRYSIPFFIVSALFAYGARTTWDADPAGAISSAVTCFIFFALGASIVVATSGLSMPAKRREITVKQISEREVLIEGANDGQMSHLTRNWAVSGVNRWEHAGEGRWIAHFELGMFYRDYHVTEVAALLQNWANMENAKLREHK